MVSLNMECCSGFPLLCAEFEEGVGSLVQAFNLALHSIEFIQELDFLDALRAPIPFQLFLIIRMI
jgi:hypothetical protein